jgi:hypothetical protein
LDNTTEGQILSKWLTQQQTIQRQIRYQTKSAALIVKPYVVLKGILSGGEPQSQARLSESFGTDPEMRLRLKAKIKKALCLRQRQQRPPSSHSR